MFQEMDTQAITITPAAAQAVRNIFSERKLEGYALRVYVAGESCCGMNFGMALDDDPQETDTAIETNGIKVIVDQVSMEYLHGATIDFVNDPQHGQGFAINSPNAGKQNRENGEEGCAGCSCSE